jgi:predicted ABC-type ATPase
MPNVVVIAGPNGAGKSTLAPALLRDTLNIPEYVNADTIAEGLSAFAPEDASFDAGRVMLQRLGSLASEQENFSFETTLATRFYARWLKELQCVGYRTSLIFLWLPKVETAIARVEERVRSGGHFVPEDTIRRRFDRGLKNLFQLYLPSVNLWRVFNAAPEKPQEIARFDEDNGEVVFEPELWKRMKK